MKVLRLSLLAVNLVAALLVLGKSFLDPNFAQTAPFEFPPEVNLPDWRFIESKPLKVHSSKDRGDSVFRAGRFYHYRYHDLPLKVEMRYVVRTQGAVDELILKHPTVQSSPPEDMKGKMGEIEGVGFHVTFVHRQRAYLSSCINPRGASTVTPEQFKHNRNTHDSQLNRLFPVLLGREDWQDYRCLWAHLSVPLTELSPEEAYSSLETAWQSWYHWWSSRFPKP
ncbi:MAG: cyanoexosortase A system-associated protein [Microcystis sp. LE19-338.1B]|jgi:cyanosortase A-associated protein|nr:cyanoexosortase A system-associated protein [Microcystis sp. LE19-338.1B]MCZ8360059.1 cyanoexosortase A system-associated protein [Microcystis sp. LE19-388.1G]